MTPQSINRAVNKYWLFTLSGLVPLVAAIVFDTPLSAFSTRLLKSLSISAKESTMLYVLLAIEAVLMFVVIFASRRMNLPRCPQCGRIFLPSNVGAVIATKHCPKCGAQVIADSSV